MGPNHITPYWIHLCRRVPLKPFKFLCDTVSQIYHYIMVVGSSVPRKACDSFPELPCMVVTSSVLRNVAQVWYCFCQGMMSSRRDRREALLSRRRELYRQQRETPEEREVRLARRRDYYKCCSKHRTTGINSRAAYSNNAQVALSFLCVFDQLLVPYLHTKNHCNIRMNSRHI